MFSKFYYGSILFFISSASIWIYTLVSPSHISKMNASPSGFDHVKSFSSLGSAFFLFITFALSIIYIKKRRKLSLTARPSAILFISNLIIVSVLVSLSIPTCRRPYLLHDSHVRINICTHSRFVLPNGKRSHILCFYPIAQVIPEFHPLEYEGQPGIIPSATSSSSRTSIKFSFFPSSRCTFTSSGVIVFISSILYHHSFWS